MSDLDDRIVAFLRAQPGATTTAVRRSVRGSASRISEALAELESEGRIANRSNGNRGHSWHAADGDPNGWRDPDEVPDSFPRTIAGLDVGGWVPPQEAAELLDTTPRTLLRWRKRKGAPACRRGSVTLFPMPHIMVWGIEFGILKERRDGTAIPKLDLRVALSRFNAREVDAGRRGLFDARSPARTRR